LGTAFPYGTFFINVTGCFILGWFHGFLLIRGEQGVLGLGPVEIRLLVAVGFTGGYTTFSTFGLEADSLLYRGQTLAGTFYLAGSVILGLLAVRLGMELAHR
jgi:CrcB protein